MPRIRFVDHGPVSPAPGVLEVRFERIDGKFNLLFWMQGMTIACVVIPLVRDFIG